MTTDDDIIVDVHVIWTTDSQHMDYTHQMQWRDRDIHEIVIISNVVTLATSFYQFDLISLIQTKKSAEVKMK